MKKCEALEILQDYPARRKVSEFYQGLETDDAQFVQAVRRLVGEEMEYPDFSYKKISDIIKIGLPSYKG